MARIKETDILLPALYIISEYPGTNTSRVKQVLMDVFRPEGEDNAPLAGRADTKFTQIVRNLLGSHYQTNGMSAYTSRDENGRFTITPEGQQLVDQSREQLECLFNHSSSYEQARAFASQIHTSRTGGQALCVYSEDETVNEGRASARNTLVRERSRRLRDAALAHYTRDGKITCAACGFDFSEVYGELGQGYIQIHHENPIYQYAEDGFDQYIADAVRNMKPLCANCHCMIHRQRNRTLSVTELRQILQSAQASRNETAGSGWHRDGV